MTNNAPAGFSVVNTADTNDPKRIAPQPLTFDAQVLLRDCMRAIHRTAKGDTPWVVIPIPYASKEPKYAKMNKLRVDPEDRSSPLGIVVRGDAYADMKYPGHLIGKFNAFEFARWLTGLIERDNEAKKKAAANA